LFRLALEPTIFLLLLLKYVFPVKTIEYKTLPSTTGSIVIMSMNIACNFSLEYVLGWEGLHGCSKVFTLVLRKISTVVTKYNVLTMKRLALGFWCVWQAEVCWWKQMHKLLPRDQNIRKSCNSKNSAC